MEETESLPGQILNVQWDAKESNASIEPALARSQLTPKALRHLPVFTFEPLDVC